MRISRQKDLIIFAMSIVLLTFFSVTVVWYSGIRTYYAPGMAASRDRNGGNPTPSRDSGSSRSESPSNIYNANPRVANLSAQSSMTGTGEVQIQATIFDADDPTAQLRLMYKKDLNCGSMDGLRMATVSSTVMVGGVQSSTVIVDNNAPNQIRGISLERGFATVSFWWEAKRDVPGIEGQVCLFVIPNDRKDDGEAGVLTKIVDLVPPIVPGPLSLVSTTQQSATIGFGAPSSDTYFSEYSIISVATPTSSVFEKYLLTRVADPNLGFVDYNKATQTVMDGLATATAYVIDISASDQSGNTSVSNKPIEVFTLADTPGPVVSTFLSSTSTRLVIDPASNPEYVEYALCVVVGRLPCADDQFVAIDGSIRKYPIWGTKPDFGGDSGVVVRGLHPSVTYHFFAKARNIAKIETSYSSWDVSSIASSPAPVSSKLPQKLLAALGASEDEFLPTGFIKIVKNDTPILYTNSLVVTLLFDSVFANYVILEESDDTPLSTLTNKTYQPIVNSRQQWQLSAGEGKKCINAVLRNSETGVKLTTYVCVIVDTTAPAPPVVRDVDLTQLDESRRSVIPQITGVAEPLSKVFITVKRPNGENAMAPLRLAMRGTLSYLRLAGSHEITYATEVGSNGSWSFEFPESLDPGSYTMAIQTQDSAGNYSGVTQQPITIPNGSSQQSGSPQSGTGGETTGEHTPPGMESTGPISSVPGSVPSSEASINGSSGGSGGSAFESGLAPQENAPATKESIGITAIESILKESEKGEETGSAASMTFLAPPALTISKATVKVVQAVLASKDVQDLNTKVLAPTIAAGAVANVAVGFTLPQVLVFLRYLFGQPIVLLRLRKQKRWGVIYHAFNKQPVDLAMVRLIDHKSNAIVQSRVTDMQGRYFFITTPGIYRIEVAKDGFRGLSVLLQKRVEDSRYSNLYHGNTFTVTAERTVVHYNIPLDPRDEEISTSLVLQEHSKQALQRVLSMLGVGVAMLSFAISPTPIIAVFLAVHLLFYGMFYRMAYRYQPTSYGVVTDNKTRKPIKSAVVRVFDEQYHKLVQTAVTDHAGRYAALVGPSRYYVTYEKDGYEKKISPSLDYSSEQTGGLGGIIARNEGLYSLKSHKATSQKPRKMIVGYS